MLAQIIICSKLVQLKKYVIKKEVCNLIHIYIFYNIKKIVPFLLNSTTSDQV